MRKPLWISVITNNRTANQATNICRPGTVIDHSKYQHPKLQDRELQFAISLEDYFHNSHAFKQRSVEYPSREPTLITTVVSGGKMEASHWSQESERLNQRKLHFDQSSMISVFVAMVFHPKTTETELHRPGLVRIPSSVFPVECLSR